MNGLPGMIALLGQIVDLGVAVMARSDGISGTGCQNLVGLQFTIFSTFIRITGLKETAAAAATKVVGSVRIHVDKVLFTDHRLNHVAQVLGHWIAEGLADQLTWILDGEGDFALFIPFGTGLELALTNPLGIKLNDALNFKIGFDPEFLHSEPDCEKFVPSLRIEPDLAAQILHGLDLCFDDMFPIFIVGQEHTVILGGPSFCAIGPICTGQVQNFP